MEVAGFALFFATVCNFIPRGGIALGMEWRYGMAVCNGGMEWRYGMAGRAPQPGYGMAVCNGGPRSTAGVWNGGVGWVREWGIRERGYVMAGQHLSCQLYTSPFHTSLYTTPLFCTTRTPL